MTTETHIKKYKVLHLSVISSILTSCNLTSSCVINRSEGISLHVSNCIYFLLHFRLHPATYSVVLTNIQWCTITMCTDMCQRKS